ncbi:hypothetical protein HYC85_016831 [Camellia sinensis]|uniref:Uncharacterized protein n=1 Tax=Camellia sinensis TaxID=4442 RepID=A0A7J7H0S0_CAMSI|nr:hypothetical protein HYC85_016831 [Camellia sinensis]
MPVDDSLQPFRYLAQFQAQGRPYPKLLSNKLVIYTFYHTKLRMVPYRCWSGSYYYMQTLLVANYLPNSLENPRHTFLAYLLRRFSSDLHVQISSIKPTTKSSSLAQVVPKVEVEDVVIATVIVTVVVASLYVSMADLTDISKLATASNVRPDEQLKKKKKISYVKKRQDVYQTLGPGSRAELPTVFGFGSLFIAPYKCSELYIDIHESPRDQTMQSLTEKISFLPFVPEIMSAWKEFASKTIKSPFLYCWIDSSRTTGRLLF